MTWNNAWVINIIVILIDYASFLLTNIYLFRGFTLDILSNVLNVISSILLICLNKLIEVTFCPISES